MEARFIGLFACAFMLPFLCIGCADPITIVSPASEPIDYQYPLDDVLRMNHLQAKGTHNSYHIEPENPADDSHRYTMPTLTEQLGTYGVRQIELDLHYKTGEGLQVHHIPLIDDVSSCPKFEDCLQELKDWSDDNPGHHVLFVWVEFKGRFRYWDLFDETVRSVWPEDRLLTPDDVQGEFGSLREALATKGWPTLGESRDNIMFMLNNGGDLAQAYSDGYTSLGGKVMFINTESFDHPLAAITKHGSDEEQAAALVVNMIVGDNAGGAGSDSDAESYADVATALAKGVHFIATDFPAPVSTQDFWFDLTGGTPSRCNVITAPPECTSADIEDLGRIQELVSGE